MFWTVSASFAVLAGGAYFVWSFPENTVQPVVTTAAVLIALITFLLNTWQTQRHARKQHTIRILLETRLSSEFRELLRKRAKEFTPGGKIEIAHYLQVRENEKQHSSTSEAVASLIALLNHCEFVAVAIQANDLDKSMMRQTIRAITCNLVNDARDIILHEQERNPRLYEHLVALFNEWRDPRVHDAIAMRGRQHFFVPPPAG